ncbi:MAG: sigma 54-interacting transcriptional regulator, partial [Deltaproteobacteria bacterium]|nr:sigma 54-interacting transcriptional regulator [Deltaproteobacteria bacterium]
MPAIPSRIAFLAPNPDIGDRALQMAFELGMEESVSVHPGHMAVALERAVALEAAEVDVLVARGATAEIIMNSTVMTPVVEIPVSGQDLAKVLRDAKQRTGLPRPRIALMAFPAIQRDLEVFASLLDINLDIYDVQGDMENIERQVARAKRDGADILVAGSVTARIAREHGLPSIQLDPGDVSLRMALLEAKKVAYARKLDKAKTQRFKAVMESSRDGILVVDAGGLIMAANLAASRILRLPFSSEGRPVLDILPVPALEACLRDGTAIQDEVMPYGDNSLLVNVTPTKVDGKPAGAILVFQPSSAIAALENKIRKSQYGKGLVSHYRFTDILGVSPQMQNTLALARRFAAAPGPVVINGETGTGKELVAQAIHAEGASGQGPFVAVNCGALPPALLESELFGYDEGAFTGARRKGKPGMFELAHTGSIFLDEIAEMDHYGQTRLLRVLQEHSVMRLGGDAYIPVSVRVIVATNRDLREEVRAGRFREDLFYRLNILRLTIPPLRDRDGDIAYLAQFFAESCREKHGRRLRLTPQVLARLERHGWPGNVRELIAVIDRLAVIAVRDTPTVEETEMALDLWFSGAEAAAGPAKDAERLRLLDALRQTGGNLKKAAE